MKLETLISRRAASIRAHLAVSSSRVTVMFFLMTRFSCYTDLVSTGLRVAGAAPAGSSAGSSREGARQRRTLAGRMRIDTDFEPLVTERLVLRRSRPEDAETISAYRSDPDVNRYQGWKRTDPEGVRREIEEMAGRAPGEAGGWVQLSVEERGSGLLVGDVGLNPADDEPSVIKVGYTMAPEFQGRGYGTEAVRALVAYALDTLGADVVRAYADAENVPSVRVAEKVGMRVVERFEGRDGDEVWVGLRYELRRGEGW
jgi:RimJ/RimL family protein N-acetyltransferase